jgi:UDPglucose 6-dehydrogenase
MNIVVQGVWHLGAVTAACLAEAGFTVAGLVGDAAEAEALSAGRMPIFEPGLTELAQAGLARGNLTYGHDPAILGGADVVWACWDTPVDADDNADVDYVTARIAATFPHLRDGAVLLVSSQLPVGSVAALERMFAARFPGRHCVFACSPENLRLGKAIDVFRRPERVVVGLRDARGREPLARLFAPFSTNIVWTGIEAAEIAKHAINAFLAVSVTFANEVATVCEVAGADMREVERALRSEPRIGERAYIRPGGAFAGGTLARDLRYLGGIGRANRLRTPLLDSVLESNHAHASWPLSKLEQLLVTLKGCRIAVLGLAYKPGTDVTRRSLAVTLCESLLAQGATVVAVDPAVSRLESGPAGLVHAPSVAAAVEGAHAVVVMTEWPAFRTDSTADLFVAAMATPIVIDPNGFLGHLAMDERIRHFQVGVSR